MDIRVIPGHPFYGVSADGCVWSRKRGIWRALALSPDGSKGYLKAKLTDGKTCKVHTVVALAYLGPRPSGLVINHIDGDKRNNAPNNLEYCTYSENAAHARRLGLTAPPFTHTCRPLKAPHVRKPKGDRSRQNRKGVAVAGAKLNDEAVRSLRVDRAQGATFRQLGKRYGVSSTQARRIALREKWAHIE